MRQEIAGSGPAAGTASAVIEDMAINNQNIKELENNSLKEIKALKKGNRILVLLSIDNKIMYGGQTQAKETPEGKVNNGLTVIDSGDLEGNQQEVAVRQITVYGGDLEVRGAVVIDGKLIVRNGVEFKGDLAVEGAGRVAGDFEGRKSVV